MSRGRHSPDNGIVASWITGPANQIRASGLRSEIRVRKGVRTKHILRVITALEHYKYPPAAPIKSGGPSAGDSLSYLGGSARGGPRSCLHEGSAWWMGTGMQVHSKQGTAGTSATVLLAVSAAVVELPWAGHRVRGLRPYAFQLDARAPASRPDSLILYLCSKNLLGSKGCLPLSMA